MSVEWILPLAAKGSMLYELCRLVRVIAIAWLTSGIGTDNFYLETIKIHFIKQLPADLQHQH
jgi:hypothetical protein